MPDQARPLRNHLEAIVADARETARMARKLSRVQPNASLRASRLSKPLVRFSIERTNLCARCPPGHDAGQRNPTCVGTALREL